MGASLTEEVLAYQRSHVGLSSLRNRIAVFVYRYPRGRFGWSEDDCSDFFCFFYPKLDRLVNRFQYRGKPFEVYLLTTLKWQLRTYAGQQAVRDLKLRVLGQQSFWSLDTGDGRAFEEGGTSGELSGDSEMPPEARRALKVDLHNHIEDPSSRRRVLLLGLKSAFRMTEALIERLAELTGYDLVWLSGVIEELRQRVREQRKRATLLSEKRNGCFFRIYCLQEQLRLCSDDHLRHELTRQMIVAKNRLSSIAEELSHVPLSPTHRDIAEVLGIPKGTVDSGLFYLRDSLSELSM